MTKFLSISFYNERFLSYEPLLWTVQGMTQNDMICSRLKVSICIQHTSLRPNLHLFRSMMIHFWVRYIFSFENCTESPKWPWHVQVQKYHHACYMHPWSPNFRSFCSTMSRGFFSYGSLFVKVHLITPNDIDMFKVKNTNRHATYTPRGPNFCPFHSTMSCFWVTAQFSEKYMEWPQMTMPCSRSNIPTCMRHTPLRPIFSSISLYNEPFLSVDPFFGKVHRMTQ